MSWDPLYVQALGLTVAVELGLLLLMTRDRRALGACVLLNLLTHPIAWSAVIGGSSIWAVELAVLALEVTGYRVLLRWSWPRAFLAGLLCNSVTTGLSWVI